MRVQSKRVTSLAVFVLALAMPTVVLAQGGYSLFGEATLVSPGNVSPTAVQLTSSGTATYSGIDFEIAAGTTLSDIQNLSSDYKFTAGSCGGGSPRFQVNVTDGTNSGNIFVYLGLPSAYIGCPMNVWLNTGNLASPASLVDTAQLPLGGPYDLHAAAQVKYGSYAVTGIQLVADGGWAVAGNVQTVLTDNVMINASTYTFESADSCKRDGWQQFTSAPGPFRNQGECVSYFSHNR